MSITSKPGHPYAIESSVDLLTWTTVRTNVAVGPTLGFTDANASTFNNHFYRVRQIVP